MSVGERSADAVGARNISRELDQSIDKIFPPIRTIMNSTNQMQKNREQMLTQINDLLLSGKAQLDDQGVATHLVN